MRSEVAVRLWESGPERLQRDASKRYRTGSRPDASPPKPSPSTDRKGRHHGVSSVLIITTKGTFTLPLFPFHFYVCDCVCSVCEYVCVYVGVCMCRSEVDVGYLPSMLRHSTH